MGIIKKLLGMEEQETENEFLEVSGGSFWMEVEDTFFITGRGTVVAGQIAEGSISIGENVYLTSRSNGTEKIVTVTGIEKFRESLSFASQGENVGILIRGATRKDIGKGDILHK